MQQHFSPEQKSDRKTRNLLWMRTYRTTAVYTEYQKRTRDAYMARSSQWRRDNPDKVKQQSLKTKDIYDALYVEIRRIKTASPCQDCKQYYHHAAMDFDHRDPQTKKFNIGTIRNKQSAPAVFEEIAKCDLVCSNCHRIRTFNKRQHTVRRADGK